VVERSLGIPPYAVSHDSFDPPNNSLAAPNTQQNMAKTISADRDCRTCKADRLTGFALLSWSILDP
jgi:hypothetical protein